MKRIFVFTAALFAVTALTQTSYGLTVEAVSVRSGVFESGVFRQWQDKFHGIYEIDEDRGTIVLKEVIHSDREGRIEEGMSYEITNVMLSGGFSALTVSTSKKGQTIYTAVREGHLGMLEVLMIGDDFYEYTSVSGGRFYLESGTVQRK